MSEVNIENIKEQILEELKKDYVLVPKKQKYQRANYDNFRRWLKAEVQGILYYPDILPLLRCKYKCQNVHNLPLKEKEDEIKKFVKDIIKLIVEE